MLLFKFGLGGRLGDGQQYFPMISLRDWVGGVVHLAEHDDASGPVQPLLPRDADQRRVHPGARPRAAAGPAVIPAPAFVIRLGAARMASELLGSMNSVPQALIDAGFEFRDPDVTTVLAAGLAQSP